MSRTTRRRTYHWVNDKSFDLTYIGLWNAGYKTAFNDPENWKTNPRCGFRNNRDDKSCSLLYEDYVKQPGWGRDFYNGEQYRRDAKKRNRRWQRRNARMMLVKEDWG